MDKIGIVLSGNKKLLSAGQCATCACELQQKKDGLDREGMITAKNALRHQFLEKKAREKLVHKFFS